MEHERLPNQFTILVVDDEDINLQVLAGILESFGYAYRLATSGEEALKSMGTDIDLVLLDIMMPDLDGFEVARRIRAQEAYSEIPIVVITALSAKRDRLLAVEAGVNDFIAKPVDATELKVRMTSLLRMKSYHDDVKNYQEGLEDMVAAKTKALKLALSNLQAAQESIVGAHLETLRRLSTAAEYKDEDTAQHIIRMSHYSALLAQKKGLPGDQVDLMLQASPMHDIGKIGIPDSILLKPAALDVDEWDIMKSHTAIGARILDSPSSNYLEAARVIALSHHERWDGSGYPNGLAEANIPLFGRICAVADVFDALTSPRPYKEPFSNDKALAIMREGRGTHFDPEILDLFLNNLDQVLELQARFRD